MFARQGCRFIHNEPFSNHEHRNYSQNYPIHAGRRFLSRTDCRYRRYENPDELLKEPKKDVWRVLINRMELRRILSVKKTRN